MNEHIRVYRRRLTRAAARGVTLVEVLIVVAIMAVISGGVTLVAFPLYKESRIKAAVIGCTQVKHAAELYQNLDATSDACPTMQDLVNAKKIKGNQTDDPWNTPYKLDCPVAGEVRVRSAGNDRRFETPDDIDDAFKPADVARVKNL